MGRIGHHFTEGAMADPTLTRAINPANALRLLAAACDNIRALESELHQSHAAQHRVSPADLALLKRCLSLRDKLFPAGSSLRAFARWVAGRSASTKNVTLYKRWIANHEPRAFAELPLAANAAPRIHFLLVGDASAVRDTTRSILEQTDPHWRLWVTHSGSLRFEDERIQTIASPRSCSAAESWNTALESIEDGFVAVVRAGDRLAPSAAAALRSALDREPEAGLVYSDEDVLNHAAERCNPIFKPDWSPETFRAVDYLGNLTAFRLSLVREVGGFRPEFGEAAVYDLALRVVEKAVSVRHVPLVLYHARTPSGARLDSDATGARAVREHLERLHIPADIEPGLVPGARQVRYRVGRPLTSIIIPSKDQPRLLERCVESLLNCDYSNQEIVLVDTGSVTAEAQALNARLAGRPGVRLLPWDRPFNYSAVNNFAASQARGEVLALLNDDTEVITPDWLERMLEHALRPEIGAVGAKLLYSNGTVQHAGVVVGLKEDTLCGHFLRAAPGDDPGYDQGLAVARNVSAVTAACLVIRRSVYEEVSGFEEQFAGDFNDIDLCLKVRQRGYQVIWTPHARLYHHECQTRGTIFNAARHTLFALERLLFLDRWGDLLARGDPFYSPHLNHDSADCTVRR
jgi:O-antigen biosynthesis protein